MKESNRSKTNARAGHASHRGTRWLAGAQYSAGVSVNLLDSRLTTERAKFLTRDACINCGSTDLTAVAEGLFDQNPLQGYLARDPWGESPLPYLQGLRWTYVRCQTCQQAFHANVLTDEWNAINFSRWMSAEAISEFERQHVGPEGKFGRASHYVKHILQLASLIDARPLLVLDFGCGNGEFLAICHQFGFDVTGLDRSTARRDKAGFDVLASIDDLTGQFHAITLFEVLEHLTDPAGVLRRLKDHLAPGGILVLETPDCTGVTGIRSVHDYECIHPLQHINGFTPATLRSIAERLGFEAITKPVSHVTASRTKVVKTEARRLLRPVLRATTQQYFRGAA